MTSSSFHSESVEIEVRVGRLEQIESAQAPSDKDKRLEERLRAWQSWLEDFECELNRRERSLDEREEELDARAGFPGALSHGARMLPCDCCPSGICARGSWCIDPYGQALHRHHSCARCHRDWKHGVFKGKGKGKGKQ